MAGPETTTVESLAVKLLSSGAGAIFPGGQQAAEALLPLFMPDIKGFMPRLPWNAVVHTNQSPYGMAMTQLSKGIAGMGQAAADRLVTADLRENGYNLVKTFNPYKDWLGDRVDNAEAKQEYEQFLQGKVEGLEHFPAAKMLYPMLASATGFSDIAQAQQEISLATTNMARMGLRRADIKSAARAGDVVSNLFTGSRDAQGIYQEKRFDSSEWGGMSRGEVAGVAAALTRDMDFMSGIQPGEIGGTDKAINRFRDTVKDYTKALAPLKDVFGDDIRKMVSTMESISGQSLTTSGLTGVKQLSQQISNRVTAGVMSIEGAGGLAVMSQLTNRTLQGMRGLSQLGYSAGASLGVVAADMSNSWMSADYTKSQWMAQATQLATDTGSSKAADTAARNYAVYAQRERNRIDAELKKLGDQDTEAARQRRAQLEQERAGISFEAYSRQVEAKMASGNLSFTEANRAVSGANEITEAAAAGSYDRLNALKNGDGARLALIGRGNQFRNLVRNSLRVSSDYGADMQLLGVRDTDAVINQTFELLQKDKELYNESDPNKLAQRLGALGVDSSRVQAITRTIAHMRSGQESGALMGQYMQVQSISEMRENEARMNARRQATEKLAGNLASTGGGWSQIFNSRNGLSLKDIQERLLKTTDVPAGMMDPKELEALNSAGVAATLVAASNSGKDELIAASMQSNLFKYGVSLEAQGNENFQKELQEVGRLRDNLARGGNEKQRQQWMNDIKRAGTVMMAYTKSGKDKVDRFLNSQSTYNYRDKKLSRRDALIQMVQDSTKAGANKSLDTLLSEAQLEDSLTKLNNPAARDIWKRFNEGKDSSGKVWRRDLNNNGDVEFAEGWGEFVKAERTRISKLTNKGEKAEAEKGLQSLIARMGNAGQGEGGGMQDIFQRIATVLEQLSDWLTTKQNNRTT